MARSFASRLDIFFCPDRRERAVLEDSEVRKEIELLKDHADVAPYLVDACEVVRGRAVSNGTWNLEPGTWNLELGRWFTAACRTPPYW
jgi:hypothetical protein